MFIKMNYFTDFCNLCLNVNCDLHNLFDEHVNIKHMLKICLPEIELDESLPLFSCDVCCNKIRSFFSYRESCVKNVQIFLRYCRRLKTVSDKAVLIKGPNSTSRPVEEVEIEDSKNLVRQTEIIDLDDYLRCDDDVIIVENKPVVLQTASEIKLEFANSSANAEEQVQETATDEASCQEMIMNFDMHEDRINISVDVVNSSDISNATGVESVQSAAKKSSEKVWHACKICNKTYKRLGLLKKHVQSHPKMHKRSGAKISAVGGAPTQAATCSTDNGEPRFMCGHCEKQFVMSTKVLKHSKESCTPAIIHCYKCKEVLVPQRLLMHRCPVNTGKCLAPYQCALCTATFWNLEHLRRHSRYHCLHCKQIFNSPSFILYHNCKVLRCNVCHLDFYRLEPLKLHMRTHSRTRRCMICRSAFNNLRLLQNHLQSHTRLMPIVCFSCSATFSQVKDLNKHNCSFTQTGIANCITSSVST